MIPASEEFRRAVARIETLSPAPVILARAMKLLRDPQSDLNSIASLVGRDPALAADIIRCANSTFYGTGTPMQTIYGAVQKIGFRETMHLLNLAVSRVLSDRDLGSYGISADDFWAESVFHGLFQRNLAKQTGCADPDEAYTVGLLRYIGRLAINQAIHDLGGGLFWDVSAPISAWERASVGFIQADAGAQLLTKWQFEPAMVQALAYQDDPGQLPEPNWLAQSLHFGAAVLPREFGAAARITAAGQFEGDPASVEFIHHCSLTPADIDTLIATTRDHYDQIRRDFHARG